MGLDVPKAAIKNSHSFIAYKSYSTVTDLARLRG